MRISLKVHPQENLTIHAGTLHSSDSPGGPRCIDPPDQPLFQQLTKSLLENSSDRAGEPTLHAQARAAVATCMYWGSYLAVLGDPSKPQWTPDTDGPISRVTNQEMARLNIEISDALARFLELKLESPQRYRALVEQANKLPLPDPDTFHRQDVPGLVFYAMLGGDNADRLMNPDRGDLPPEAWDDIDQHPVRVISNSLTLQAWRNAPIEDIHAGIQPPPLPVLQRRLTDDDLGAIVTFAIEAMKPFFRLFEAVQGQGGDIEERMATGLRHEFFLYPRGWTLTENCRPIKLGREEPGVPEKA